MIEIEIQNETYQSQERLRFAAVPRIGEGIRLREPWQLSRAGGQCVLKRSFHRPTGLDASARDFLAGMTDRYAVSLYEELFIPKPWIEIRRGAS